MIHDEEACLAHLEAAHEKGQLPGDCDADALQAEGLVEERHGSWHLTPKGRLRLQNLRSVYKNR